MRNQEVARLLYGIAELLELQAVQFKPQAYRKAARSVEELSEDIAAVHSSSGKGGLMRIPGVGEGIAGRIDEFLRTGRSAYYEGLKKNMPGHIAELASVPGLGPKKIKLLNARLRVSSLADLEKAAKSHKIASIPGFGAKTEGDILRGIELVRKGQERSLIHSALRTAGEVSSYLLKSGAAGKVVVAGSVRRMQETIGDLDFVVVSGNPSVMMDYFAAMPGVSRVLVKGDTKCSVLLHSGIQVDLRVVPQDSFGAALQYFTGDKQHNVRVREIAVKKGMKLNEYGLFDSKGRYVAGKSEEEIYRILGMAYIEPELRRDNGEVEASLSGRLPKLVAYGSIKGDLHCHTSMSDGSSSLQEMAGAAKALGYEYVAITDHSVSERIASGLKEDAMESWLKEIRAFSGRQKGIRVLAGSEVSIRADGSLDYSDGLLKKMDIVVASVHSGFKSSREIMTRRIVKALSSGLVDILGHPTGRIVNRREPYQVDFRAVVKAAMDNNVLLEINASERMDLKDALVREAAQAGAKFVISTDSHSIHELQNMRIGVGIARRGWLPPEAAVNTMPFRELSKFFRKLRSG